MKLKLPMLHGHLTPKKGSKKMLKINEIFRSIDGEVCGYSTLHSFGLQGGWSIFIRLQGCNLRCPYCDTLESLSLEGGQKKTVSEIIREVENLSIGKIKKVTITGGEPLLQKNLIFLLENLYDIKYSISIETNGTQKLSKSIRQFVDSFIIDIKLKNSGIQIDIDNLKKNNFHITNNNDFFKFVITNEEDFKDAIDIKNYLKTITNANFAISPLFSNKNEMKINPIKLIEKYQEYDFMINLQLHKLIGAK